MKKGFTLIELSVVLVIIGLLIGGVLVGMDLVKSAKVTKTIGEINQIKIAVGIFQERYECLPGDCKAAILKGVDSINGDGDESIGYVHPCGYENYRAWYQLAMAGILKGMGSFQSVNSLSCTEAKTRGIHFPKSSFGDNLGYGFGGGLYSSGMPEIRLGEAIGMTNEVEYWDFQDGLKNHSIKPVDAIVLDRKFVDGMPNTGMIKVRPHGGNARTCTEDVHGYSAGSSAPLTRKYRTDELGTCVLLFPNYEYKY